MTKILLRTDFSVIDATLLKSNCKIIHQIWFNFKDPEIMSDIPEKYTYMCNSWSLMNPNWTHIVWNDKLADSLINIYPEYKNIYYKFTKPILRADFIRFCFLHRYGGLYADMDTECRKPIDDLFQEYKKRHWFIQ